MCNDRTSERWIMNQIYTKRMTSKDESKWTSDCDAASTTGCVRWWRRSMRSRPNHRERVRTNEICTVVINETVEMQMKNRNDKKNVWFERLSLENKNEMIIKCRSDEAIRRRTGTQSIKTMIKNVRVNYKCTIEETRMIFDFEWKAKLV